MVSGLMHRTTVTKCGQSPCMGFGEGVCAELTNLLYVGHSIPDVYVPDNTSNN
ncbi:hypothetical protein BH09CHL1_BH09CHL1_27190 [soil metagenome]